MLIDGRQFPCSDFLTIGETRTETATDHYALWPHYRHERALADEYKTALHTYIMRRMPIGKPGTKP